MRIRARSLRTGTRTRTERQAMQDRPSVGTPLVWVRDVKEQPGQFRRSPLDRLAHGAEILSGCGEPPSFEGGEMTGIGHVDRSSSHVDHVLDDQCFGQGGCPAFVVFDHYCLVSCHGYAGPSRTL